MPSGKRVVAYIDGFNLYHAVGDLGEDHLKWLDLRALAEVRALRHEIASLVAEQNAAIERLLKA